jgi:hypothetical protein
MWPEAPTLNAELRCTVLERSRSDGGVSKSNVLGWQSDLNLHLWGGDPVLRLCQFALQRAQAYTHDTVGGVPRYKWMAQLWANLSPRGGSNQLHSHPGCYWAAVYYVDDGYGGSEDPALAGELVFLDPRYPMIQMVNPELRYRPPGATPDHPEIWLRPRTGMMVFFPAWLSHLVRPYSGSGTRISIALNLSLRRIGPRSGGDG